MKQPKLKYHFHNPNPPDKSAEYILKILMQVNAVKAENAVRSAQEKIKNENQEVFAMGRQINTAFEVEHKFKGTGKKETEENINTAIRQLCIQYINKVISRKRNGGE